MRRRDVIAAGLGLTVSGRGIARAAAGDVPQRKLERIALSTSSYRAHYDGWRYSVEGVQPRLSHLTLPAFAKARFGLTRVELWDQQFGPEGPTPEQCRKVRAAADAAGATIVNIEVEDLPALDQADPVLRAQSIEACKAWLDKARILGAGSIRVNLNRRKGEANREAAIETLRAAAAYGRTQGVRVLLENHGGFTASIPDMVALVRAVGDDFCRIEIDWGAWTPPGDRYAEMAAAMPLVHIVSAKGELFDETSYRHTAFDVARLVRDAEASGFKGLYSIELWGTPAPRDTDRAVRSFIQTIADNMR